MDKEGQSSGPQDLDTTLPLHVGAGVSRSNTDRVGYHLPDDDQEDVEQDDEESVSAQYTQPSGWGLATREITVITCDKGIVGWPKQLDKYEEVGHHEEFQDSYSRGGQLGGESSRTLVDRSSVPGRGDINCYMTINEVLSIPNQQERIALLQGVLKLAATNSWPAITGCPDRGAKMTSEEFLSQRSDTIIGCPYGGTLKTAEKMTAGEFLLQRSTRIVEDADEKGRITLPITISEQPGGTRPKTTMASTTGEGVSTQQPNLMDMQEQLQRMSQTVTKMAETIKTFSGQSAQSAKSTWAPSEASVSSAASSVDGRHRLRSVVTAATAKDSQGQPDRQELSAEGGQTPPYEENEGQTTPVYCEDPSSSDNGDSSDHSSSSDGDGKTGATGGKGRKDDKKKRKNTNQDV